MALLSAVPPERVVHFVVGGRHFFASLDTLTWCDGSKIATFFGARLPNDGSAPFFDRDPEAFAAILNALRKRKMPSSRPSGVSSEDWSEEVEYWLGGGKPTTPLASGANAALSLGTLPGTPQPPPPPNEVQEVPAASLLELADVRPHPYPPPSGLPFSLRPAPLQPKDLMRDMWHLVRTAISAQLTTIPYRVLRRAHCFPMLYVSGTNSGSSAAPLSVLMFLRGINVDFLEPVHEAVLAAAMRALFKSFLDQRINPDLLYELSTSGSGEEEVLHIKKQPPPK